MTWCQFDEGLQTSIVQGKLRIIIFCPRSNSSILHVSWKLLLSVLNKLLKSFFLLSRIIEVLCIENLRHKLVLLSVSTWYFACQLSHAICSCMVFATVHYSQVMLYICIKPLLAVRYFKLVLRDIYSFLKPFSVAYYPTYSYIYKLWFRTCGLVMSSWTHWKK